MLKRILAVSLIGLAVGLSACDNRGQEQAQQPANKQQATPTPAPQQGTQGQSGSSGSTGGAGSTTDQNK
ncbi:MAG: hypothetical protein ACM31L_18895 [Actinomycetota bacterium]